MMFNSCLLSLLLLFPNMLAVEFIFWRILTRMCLCRQVQRLSCIFHVDNCYRRSHGCDRWRCWSFWVLLSNTGQNNSNNYCSLGHKCSRWGYVKRIIIVLQRKLFSIECNVFHFCCFRESLITLLLLLILCNVIHYAPLVALLQCHLQSIESYNLQSKCILVEQTFKI